MQPPLFPDIHDPQESARARAEELRRLIEHHNRMYYLLDAPEIGDADYNALFREY
jgi:DNA ligase (NAD+)